ncbi:MAG: MgtC/SapB family protein [Sphingorhabdus sp.]
MDQLLIRLAVALAIGLLVGLERGWHTRTTKDHRRAAGFRTFALTGLLGGVAGAISDVTGPVVLGIALASFTAIFGAFHWMEAQADKDLSVTSVVAGMLTFMLGAYAVLGDLQIAIAGAVAMTAMLALREPLHRWVASLRWEEIRAVLILLVMTFLLLPIIPNRTVDPWDSLNPAEIWLLAIMIAAVSFGGYVSIRVWGDRLGVVMAAVAGGLASSTATTLTLARLGKEYPGSARLLAGGILLSGVVMLARVGIMAALLNRAMIAHLLPGLGVAAAVMLTASTILLLRRQDAPRPQMQVTNPLEIGTALKLAAVIAVVMLASQLVQTWLGGAGVLAVAAASGIVDVDATTISMTRLGGHQIALGTAIQAIAVAVGVNTLSKAIMAASAGNKIIGAYVGGVSAIALIAGWATMIMG